MFLDVFSIEWVVYATIIAIFYVVFPEETMNEICGLPASSPNASKTDDKDVSLEELNSSIIKFCLTEATPYRKR